MAEKYETRRNNEVKVFIEQSQIIVGFFQKKNIYRFIQDYDLREPVTSEPNTKLIIEPEPDTKSIIEPEPIKKRDLIIDESDLESDDDEFIDDEDINNFDPEYSYENKKRPDTPVPTISQHLHNYNDTIRKSIEITNIHQTT